MEPDDEGVESCSSALGDETTLPAIKPSRPGWLGRRRRTMVLVLSAIGLATFFSPLIKTDSSVAGRTRWSPMQIAPPVMQGTLPVCSDSGFTVCDDPRTRDVFLVLDTVLGCASAYALLLVIAAAALLFPRADFVGTAAALGIVALYAEARSHYMDLRDFIRAASPNTAGYRVYAGTLDLVLVAVLGLLIWIAVTKALDY